ncbi:restriction endonuclease subunit S [Ciceribacter ferrooxidans]|uniref:Type I restriction modification DNA specificity domain-containing protein n=1 Tax=Ciceribacter ferrooxidans TaxID=2509717 RepID=A0A4Q2SAH1_9HYPH|nr:restriction endonuclease subunit S [Ciceribacter ferrooxidans]RYB98044.1 hypothetical protein EUU22_23440 [Ciceribacter ferrooxidans]
MSKLPQGWSSETMGELADFIMGQAPPGSECNKSGSGTPFVKAGEFGTERPVIREWTTRPLKQGCASDVFICVVGATAGKINLGADCAIGRSVAAIRPSGALDQHFLYRFLSTRVRELRAGSAGSAQGVISKDDLAAVEMALPPLPEQRRIVAKIDSLTGKSRRARDHLDHIPRLVEKYKQAVLAAAFAEANGSSGHLVTIGEIASEVRNGLSKKPTDGPEGTPILRISAVRPRQVRIDDVRYYPTEEVPASAMLRTGDLLFTRYNGNPEFTAVCGQVRHMVGELTYPDKLIRVRMARGVEPSFVELMATSEQARRWLNPHIKSAAGQHGISGADLKRLPIPLPSLATQQGIVRRIEAAFVWIDRLASEATSARRLIDKLDQALLGKAFRGELVPQDPEDEPASVLLDRIRTERDTAPKTRRGRRPAA